MAYKIQFKLDFSGQARTLPPSVIGKNKSRWKVEGKIREDYYEWVNEFSAKHPVYGWVKGDFEKEVSAKSKKAYDHFIKHHPFQEWDYWDI